MKYFKTGIKGGCYNEFVQGKWNGGHWHADPLYLYDDIFYDLCLDTNPFLKAIMNYTHWGVTEVTRDNRDQIIEISRETGGESPSLSKNCVRGLTKISETTKSSRSSELRVIR